jgi:glycosyltransferase involved in cell wall biosynthesis
VLDRKQINVMHCLTAVYDGGQETFLVKTFNFIQNSSKNKYNFIICSLSHATNKELIEKYKKSGINFFSFNFANRKSSYKDIFRNIGELFKLAKLIRKEKVDILYGHDFFSAFVVRLAYLNSLFFYFYKVKKLYISIHLIFYWFKKSHHLINRFLSYFTDKIICVSQSVCDYSITHDKINKNKYKVIYNGIDVNEFSLSGDSRSRFRKEFGIKDSTKVIGAVGNISHRKGQKYLVQSFNEIQKKYPDSMLIIFGSCRGVDKELEYKKELDKMIIDMELCNKIKFFNPRLDINNIYPIFDLYVMPSTVEGFGLALAEAMAMERVVIGSDIPPFREIIDDGYDGFLFKSENYIDLKDKMELAFNKNSDELIQIGKNARNKIVNKFNSVYMGKEYEKLYNIYND